MITDLISEGILAKQALSKSRVPHEHFQGAAPRARSLWFVPRSKAVDDRSVVHAWWDCNRLLRLVVFRRLQGRWNRDRRSNEMADGVWQSSWLITGRGVCAALSEPGVLCEARNV